MTSRSESPTGSKAKKADELKVEWPLQVVVDRVKACGEGTVLCREAAADLLNLWVGDVKIPETTVFCPDGTELHEDCIRCGSPEGREVFERDGIKVTTAVQTVLDLLEADSNMDADCEVVFSAISEYYEIYGKGKEWPVEFIKRLRDCHMKSFLSMKEDVENHMKTW